MGTVFAAAFGCLIAWGVARALLRLPQGARNFLSLAGGLFGLFGFMFVLFAMLSEPPHPGQNIFWGAIGGTMMMLGGAWCAVRSAMRLMILSHKVDRAMGQEGSVTDIFPGRVKWQ
jgi:hypothetical protein